MTSSVSLSTTRPAPAGPSTQGAPAPVPGGRPASRLVTDAPTRMFHWLFALSFLGAYLTAESEQWRALHVTLGYTLAGLLAWRVLYGLIGPKQAGLGVLWRKLGAAPAWLRAGRDSLARQGLPGALKTIHWRQGQNLLMAAAIVLLLVLVLPLTLSGYATYNDWGDVLGGDWVGEVHELIANTFLAVVLAHLALITGLSLLRRKNQARPMLTGRTEGPGPDLVKANRAWLAVLLLAAVLGFGAWEWQQSPSGLIPTQAGLSSGSAGQHNDDD